MERVLSFAAFALLASSAMALNIDALWDYGNPELSERRFLAALDGATQDDSLILKTQIARTHGLRRDFLKAREWLAALEPELSRATPEVQVRFFLERGRTFASTAHSESDRTPASLELARRDFLQAYELAAGAQLDDLAIDALHMMPVVEVDPDRQLAWNERALAYLQRSAQPEAKRWEGSLRHNLGYGLHLKGRFEEALAQFRLSRAAYERNGRVRNARIADWMVAWTLRAQKKHAQALAIQLQLERAWDADGEPDPHVYEELAHLYRALGNETRAAQYDGKLKAAAK